MTNAESQPRIGKIHDDTVALELLLLSAPAKMPLHRRTLLPLEYTSGSGARGGFTCGVGPHRCGFRSVCLPSFACFFTSQFVGLLSFSLSLAVSAFSLLLLLLLLLLLEKSTFYLTSPVSSEVFGREKEEDCWIVLLADDGRVFCCFKTRILLERRTEENRRLHFHQMNLLHQNRAARNNSSP